MPPLFIIVIVMLFGFVTLLIVGGYTFFVFVEQLVQLAAPEEF